MILITQALVYSLAFCAAGAALEGLCAGGGIKQRLAELRLPRYAVPFWGWVIIGGLYYVIAFMILYRLFSLPPSLPRNNAFALLGAIMFINALWNYFFFRTRNLFHAYLLGPALQRNRGCAPYCLAANRSVRRALVFALHSLFVLCEHLGLSHLEVKSTELAPQRVC